VLTRSQGSFSYAELCAVADAGMKNAQYYAQALARAGYINTVTPHRGPHPARFAAAQRINSLRAELDAQYHKTRVAGEVLESRLQVFSGPPRPKGLRMRQSTCSQFSTSRSSAF
jgi:hypothetical protein